MSYNQYGCKLIDDQILVLPDEVKDHLETESGFKLYKARDTATENREQAAQDRATIVDMAEEAYIDLPEETRPKIGDRVIIDRYAGHFYDGSDGVRYRLVTSKNIVTLINF